MIDLSLLEEVILEQKQVFSKKDCGLPRETSFEPLMASSRAVVISGVRRSGKSTLLRQIAARLDDYHYVNLDDERLLDFKVEDFNQLLLLWQKRSGAKTILIDEIQNVDSWERFIRRAHDDGYKIFLTGSNAKLLSSELATRLTGRYLKVELYPFSFREYLAFKGIRPDKRLTTSAKATVTRHFDQYLVSGGFPEYVKRGEPDLLKRTYDDIVFRDIIARFGIRETTPFRELTTYLFSNFTKEVSYGSLAKALDIKSPMTVRQYVGFLQESYLVFELLKYDPSYRKQLVAGRKVYVIDNGMRNSVAFSTSEDRGRSLENAVFLELKRRGQEVFYFRQAHECDFLVREKNTVTAAIQVTSRLHADNREREIAGLVEACAAFGLKEGIIITENEEKTIEQGGGIIQVMPAWKWLLGG
jgi:hypothetical protein